MMRQLTWTLCSRYFCMSVIPVLIFGVCGMIPAAMAGIAASAEIPEVLATVFENAELLSEPRQGRLPLYILPISSSLNGLAVVVRDLFEPTGVGVRIDVRQHGDDLLVILVNEDNHRHMGVDLHGLKLFEGRKLFELYGSDEVTVENDGFTLRMRPLECRLYCTSRKVESHRRTGRDYVSP